MAHLSMSGPSDVRLDDDIDDEDDFDEDDMDEDDEDEDEEDEEEWQVGTKTA